MNANEKFIAADAHVDQAAVKPLPNSRKIYVTGSRADLRVPMREISQSDTDTAFGGEKNPPIFVYDCSGPYSDPQANIDIRQGLPALRAKWIAERGDSEPLPGLSSDFGRVRAADAALDELRFPGLQRRPLVAVADAAVDIVGNDADLAIEPGRLALLLLRLFVHLVDHRFVGRHIGRLAPAIQGHAQDAEQRQERHHDKEQPGREEQQHDGQSTWQQRGRSLSPTDVEIGLTRPKPCAGAAQRQSYLPAA